MEYQIAVAAKRPGRFVSKFVGVLGGSTLLFLSSCSGGDSYQGGEPIERGYIADDAESGQIENNWIDTEDEVLSTFSADVDTASYSIMRRDLNDGRLPEQGSIRVEEYLNYFKYADAAPETGDAFRVHLEATPSPFGPPSEKLHLLRIGIQSEMIPIEERDPVNLVFLVDVSGSMQSDAKLPLVKYTLGLLIDKLAPTDTLGIVVYAGGGRDRASLYPSGEQIGHPRCDR